jgi:hypothetical protein
VREAVVGRDGQGRGVAGGDQHVVQGGAVGQVEVDQQAAVAVARLLADRVADPGAGRQQVPDVAGGLGPEALGAAAVGLGRVDADQPDRPDPPQPDRVPVDDPLDAGDLRVPGGGWVRAVGAPVPTPAAVASPVAVGEEDDCGQENCGECRGRPATA